MLIGTCCTPAPVAADTETVLLQFVYRLGSEPTSQMQLAIGFSNPEYEAQFVTTKHKPAITIPLYTSGGNNTIEQLYVSDGSQSLCDRNPVVCITIGAIIGAGAIYVLTEANKDIDTGNVEISINTKSE